MNTIKKLFSSFFGLSKKNKNRGKKGTKKHRMRKSKAHKKLMKGGWGGSPMPTQMPTQMPSQMPSQMPL